MSRSNKTDGLQSYCKTCSKKTTTSRRLSRTPEERERDRIARKCWTYGITAERLTEILELQEWACVCGAQLDWSNFNIDHDHNCCAGNTACGNCIRGALCTNCNVALGMIKDDPDTAVALAMYLVKFQDVLSRTNDKEVLQWR